VWGGKVYTTKEEFNGYLKSKGLSYKTWVAKNPHAAPWEPGAQPSAKAEDGPVVDLGSAAIVLMIATACALLLLPRPRSALARLVRRSVSALPRSDRPHAPGPPWSRPSSPATPADESYEARRLVDDLVRVTNTLESLKATLETATAPERPKPVLQPEDDVLDEKPPGEVYPLKAARDEAISYLEPLAASEPVTQDEKPSVTPRQSETDLPRRPALAREAVSTSVVRALQGPGVEQHTRAPDSGATRQLPLECEIRFAGSDKTSHFFAVATHADGTETTLGASPSFRWPKSGPPVATPPAAAALRALVKALEREGWAVAGRGDDWFGFRLRAAKVDRAGAAGF
jgi:hypothetical protein